MVENHKKIIFNEGIIISFYSYNNDYVNNFGKLFNKNNDETLIDLRDYIEEYKKINKVDENIIYIL